MMCISLLIKGTCDICEHIDLLTMRIFFFLSGMVFEYLSAVLTDVLHCQREPLPFCLALLQYDKELVSSEPSALPHPSIISLNAYYSKWLPRQCQEELVSFVSGAFVNFIECQITIVCFCSLRRLKAVYGNCHHRLHSLR